LKDAGCDRLFQDHGATGSNMDRPGLEKVLRALKPGDTLVVWRLDRLGRSLTDLVRFIEELGERGCEFRSLNEAIDTSTSGGRLIFHIMAAFAEFERNLISERTRAGLIAARQRGRRLGRPPVALSDCDLSEARRALVERRERLGEIAARYRVSPSTLRRRLSAEGQERREPSQRPRNGAGRARPVQRRSAVVQKLMGSACCAISVTRSDPDKAAASLPVCESRLSASLHVSWYLQGAKPCKWQSAWDQLPAIGQASAHTSGPRSAPRDGDGGAGIHRQIVRHQAEKNRAPLKPISGVNNPSGGDYGPVAAWHGQGSRQPAKVTDSACLQAAGEGGYGRPCRERLSYAAAWSVSEIRAVPSA
ncbi:recombinase family protein, partial [uncultured Paracoccus sp.]|uniref:recombinase family protein n=1 Tax=uncultured Paracoccus sp. TaxID=189685 RepID=UPI002592B1DD